MADITITLDFSDLTAAAVNFPQPTVTPGVAPTIDWGALPTASIDWTTVPPTTSITGGSAPSIDMTNAAPPTITFPTAQQILTGLWAGFGAATTWVITIELVP